MKKISALSSALFLMLAGLASAQTTTPTTTVLGRDVTIPTLTITSPYTSIKHDTNTIVIFGQAKDAGPGTGTAATVPTGVSRVEYKLTGQSWKTLMMDAPGALTVNYFGSFKLEKGKSIRISVRAFDRSGNESVTSSFMVRRSRFTRQYQSVVPTTTTP